MSRSPRETFQVKIREEELAGEEGGAVRAPSLFSAGLKGSWLGMDARSGPDGGTHTHRERGGVKVV